MSATWINSKSEHVDVFPITFDRYISGYSYVYIRKDTYADETFKQLDENLQAEIENNEIFYGNIDKDIRSYYIEKQIPSISSKNGRALTEHNISSLIYKLTDKDFVISKTTSCLEFMLNGHYFKVTDSRILNTTPLYVRVEFKDFSSNFSTLNAIDKDIESTYYLTGVEFSEKPETDSKYRTLQLLDDDGNIPTSSSFIFSPNDNLNRIPYIDGGEI